MHVLLNEMLTKRQRIVQRLTRGQIQDEPLAGPVNEASQWSVSACQASCDLALSVGVLTPKVRTE